MGRALGLRFDGRHAEMTKPCAFMVNGTPVHQDRAWLAERREAAKSVSGIADDAGGRTGFRVGD